MLLYIVFFACIFTEKIVLLYNMFVYSIYLGFMKINQWIFYSLFLGLISCQSQEQTFTVHCTGLDAYEGDTVYLWRYGADRMTGDRDYGKAPLDFAIIRNGEVSFSGKEDTLHIYGMEHSGSMNFFYPERGKLTLTNVVPPAMPVPDKSTNPHSQNVRLWKLWHEDDFPLEATRQFVFDNARNAIGWMVFDRWAAIYPDELETLYQKTPSQMRDSTSVLIGLKRMLDTTRSLKPGDHFIDFKQVEYAEKDSLLFSNITGQGHSVCLLFFLKKMLSVQKSKICESNILIYVLLSPLIDTRTRNLKSSFMNWRPTIRRPSWMTVAVLRKVPAGSIVFTVPSTTNTYLMPRGSW